MRLPRWTVYPALAVLAVFAIIAFPHRVRPNETLVRQRSDAVAPRRLARPTPAEPAPGAVVELTDFLPRPFFEDGTLDYTAQVQAALDAAAGRTLRLPDFPLLVSRRPGHPWCLRVASGTTIEGSSSSVLVERRGGVQILRAEDVEDVRFAGFALQGVAEPGTALAHGLLQVTGARGVVVDGMTVRAGDADGIAIANARDVRVSGCSVAGAAKSGIYLSACRDAVVTGNRVRDFGGHRTADGAVTGTGIQLSSCARTVCSDNVVANGTGVGILCNAFAGGAKPQGCVIASNRVEEVANASNQDVSCGIRLANGNQDRATGTLVTGNSVRACGIYGVYVENHDGSLVDGNLVTESERSGIAVSTVAGLQLTGNVVLNSNTSGRAGHAGLLLLNGAADVRARGNVVRDLPGFANALDGGALRDVSSGGGHDLEPDVRYAAGAPEEGRWSRGDLVFNARPARGAPLGWVCVEDGEPGVWAPFAPIQ